MLICILVLGVAGAAPPAPDWSADPLPWLRARLVQESEDPYARHDLPTLPRAGTPRGGYYYGWFRNPDGTFYFGKLYLPHYGDFDGQAHNDPPPPVGWWTPPYERRVRPRLRYRLPASTRRR